ncbi:MAG TPA: CpsB/CapC family capsule biosynthesis tyrosine phosphatase [Solirubrobacteraceae bacterium]|nr:CpsB/CapC family capsule biosynthesis tyrosine phosphatase [Solirubrobacteraceae bacterium]
MIDLHCHVLPGIDDGPATIEGSLALARTAAAAGIETIVATPHVSWEHRNNPTTIAAALERTRAALADADVQIKLRAGAEIALTLAAEMEPAEVAALGLGGGRWLLMECPFTPSATGFDSALIGLRNRGQRIVLAHPERCPAFHRDPHMLRMLVEAGMLSSLTAGSLVGRFGRTVQRFARKLAAEGLVHNVTSDAHDHLRRAPGIASELQQAGLGPLRAWLTEEVPAAILEDSEEIPPPPAQRPGRASSRWWRR